MSPPDALPSIETLLDKLREHLARPEWNASLGHRELLVLFDHLDQLAEQAARADALAERWWRPNVPHSPDDYGRAYAMRWRALWELLDALPNPHTRGDDHGK